MKTQIQKLYEETGVQLTIKDEKPFAENNVSFSNCENLTSITIPYGTIFSGYVSEINNYTGRYGVRW